MRRVGDRGAWLSCTVQFLTLYRSGCFHQMAAAKRFKMSLIVLCRILSTFPGLRWWQVFPRFLTVIQPRSSAHEVSVSPETLLTTHCLIVVRLPNRIKCLRRRLPKSNVKFHVGSFFQQLVQLNKKTIVTDYSIDGIERTRISQIVK